MSSGPGIFRRLFYKWKTLKLPWRKQFLIGADLSGNTFWEFKDAINSNRWRRIVKYSRTPHFADVRISPQWHQWLRHTRDEAPSIQEQQYEVSRQAMMKQLAAEADERWKSVPSYLDAPNKQQTAPAAAVHEPVGGATPDPEGAGVKAAVGDEAEVELGSRGQEDTREKDGRAVRKEREPSPWDRPQEKWEPASWIPGVAQRR